MLRRPFAMLACLALMTGCSGEETAPEAATAETEELTPDVFAEEAAATELNETQLAKIRELPEQDAELAMAQKLCPIGESPLGSMGKPYKVVVDGRPVFLCCGGCESQVLEDPEQALALVDAAAGSPE